MLAFLIRHKRYQDTHNSVACDLKVLLSQWCLMKVTVQVARGPDRKLFIKLVSGCDIKFTDYCLLNLFSE